MTADLTNTQFQILKFLSETVVPVASAFPSDENWESGIEH